MPRTTRTSSSPLRKACARRDLPTPAAPRTVNSWHERLSTASSIAALSRSNSRSRPTIAPSKLERDGGAALTATSRKAVSGADFPFSSRGSTSSTVAASPASSRVSAPSKISPGRAACSSRAVTLTASPVASRSAVPVTTSPVLTPIRISSVVPKSRSETVVQLPQTRAQIRRGTQGPQRIVFMQDRNPEHSHHSVPDELLNRPAMPADYRTGHLEIPRQHRSQRFRVQLLPQSSRPRHVGEQHGHDFPLLTADDGRRHQGLAARLAEARPTPALVATGRTAAASRSDPCAPRSGPARARRTGQELLALVCRA